MKTQTQRQVGIFQQRAEAIAKGLDAQKVTFPKEGDEQTCIIQLEPRRSFKLSHDLFRGHMRGEPIWPQPAKGSRARGWSGERKTFRMDYTKPDDDILKALKEKWLPWYEVECETVEESIGKFETEEELAKDGLKALAEALGAKPEKLSSLAAIGHEGGSLEARVVETRAADMSSTARLTFEGPLDAVLELIKLATTPQKKGAK